MYVYSYTPLCGCHSVNPNFLPDEPLVRLELAISWASDIAVSLHVRLTGAPIPITIELKDVSIRCTVRIELKDFTDKGALNMCAHSHLHSYTRKYTHTYTHAYFHTSM